MSRRRPNYDWLIVELTLGLIALSVVLWALLSAANCRAQGLDGETLNVSPFVAVRATHADGTQSRASGAAVDLDGDGRIEVLTNAHVLRDRSPVVAIGVWLPSTAEWVSASVRFARYDVGDDVAVLATNQLVTSPTDVLTFSATEPRSGEPVVSAGFAHGAERTIRRGTITPNRIVPPGATLTYSLATTQGESGMPIVNTSGEMVALHWGNDKGNLGHGMPVSRVLRVCSDGGCRIFQPRRAPVIQHQPRPAATQYVAGPAGPPGPPGSVGPPGPPGAAASVDYDRVTAIVTAETDHLRQDLRARLDDWGRRVLADGSEWVEQLRSDILASQHAATTVPGPVVTIPLPPEVMTPDPAPPDPATPPIDLSPVIVMALGALGISVPSGLVAYGLSYAWRLAQRRRQRVRRTRDRPHPQPQAHEQAHPRPVVLQTPPTYQRTTENEYIDKPLIEEAEAYREAIRREAKTSPSVAGHLERVENTVAQLMGRQPSGSKPGWKTD